ncbi:unnamed protein product [Rotaria socialis]|uniref:Uncharacterized protein n=2 Tax=Rotaria socialis TaxID=392032 RepID=A0A821LNC8_9BILA|nr:unnamed protein product [Rotaria socialis]CAF3683285.1 unnamed protein product [Rotaria socialis]CAF3770554.1 unnamed protein product [Rotaria socialis]CAF4639102.1 unnamed protein product [Rotaria socialis]CAF4657162.1 unnamed protein product [Rotaria socialis]
MKTLSIFALVICSVYVVVPTIGIKEKSLVMHGRVTFVPNFKIPTALGARLTVTLQDTSLADAPAKAIVRTSRKANRFPIRFTIQYSPSQVSSRSSYSLSVTIKNKKNELLYINNVHTKVIPLGEKRTKFIDVPVINVTRTSSTLNKKEWPELVGKKGEEAVKIIKKETGFDNVLIVEQGSPITLDYRTDRVRVFVDANGIVVTVPKIG